MTNNIDKKIADLLIDITNRGDVQEMLYVVNHLIEDVQEETKRQVGEELNKSSYSMLTPRERYVTITEIGRITGVKIN